MSRTRKRIPGYLRGIDANDMWSGWEYLLRELERGHRVGKEARVPVRQGGWLWGFWEPLGRNGANAKRWMKRHTSKMRRREAKREVKDEQDEVGFGSMV